MALPESRNTTYAIMSQVKSADLNDFQDRIIDVANKMAGTYVLRETYVYPPEATVSGGSSDTSILAGRIGGTAETNTQIDVRHPGDASDPAPFPYVEINVMNAAADQGAAIFTSDSAGAHGQRVGAFDDSVIVFEMPMQMDTIGGNEVDIGAGMHEIASTINPAAADIYAMFIKETGDTNWQCKVGNGSATTSTDSGVPPVADTWQMLRIELHGQNTPIGVLAASPVARFYIDGSLVATTQTANVPSGTTKGMGGTAHARATATGPSADVVVRAGPMMLSWAPFSA